MTHDPWIIGCGLALLVLITGVFRYLEKRR